MTARQAEAPAALYAVMVMVLVPTSSGIAEALHCSVPVAVPELPVEFVQVTEVTLAPAMPLKAMVAAEVDTMVIDGEAMASEGGPVGVVVTGESLPAAWLRAV